MLYVTTRSNQEIYTAQRALAEDRAPDGGFYVPFRAPSFSGEDLAAMPFHQRMAEVLNTFFQTKLTGWDISFCIGRSSMKWLPMGNRITVGEFWHNPGWEFAQMERSLARLLCPEAEQPGNWLRIAIRIAVLAAILPEIAQGAEPVDVSVLSGDLLWAMSIWYGRKWGLPVGSSILCCNENKNIWDLFCHGQMRTDSVAIATEVPEADLPLPADLERLIHGCCGTEEVLRYLDISRRGEVYDLEESRFTALREGQYVSVVSSGRIRDAIPGALRTHRYLLSPATSLAYAGLLDYRARKGIFRNALVVSERNPLLDSDTIARVLEIPEAELKKHF